MFTFNTDFKLFYYRTKKEQNYHLYDNILLLYPYLREQIIIHMIWLLSKANYIVCIMK